MKLIACLLSTATALMSIQQQVAPNSFQASDLIKQKHGNIFMGEPFLTSEAGLNELWFEIAGELAKSAWQGFLSGLYAKPFEIFMCTSIESNRAMRELAESIEKTQKEVFFLHLARNF